MKYRDRVLTNLPMERSDRDEYRRLALSEGIDLTAWIARACRVYAGKKDGRKPSNRDRVAARQGE